MSSPARPSPEVGSGRDDIADEGLLFLTRLRQRSRVLTPEEELQLAQRIADKARTIRLPVPVVDKLRRINRAESILTGELGHRPSVLDVAAAVGVSASEIEQIRTVEGDALGKLRTVVEGVARESQLAPAAATISR